MAAEPPPPEPAPPPPAPEAAAPAEAVPPPVPEEPAEETFTVTTGVGLRFGAQFQDLRDPESLGMFSVDEIYVEPRFSGKVLSFVGWTANFAVDGRPATSVSAGAPPPPAGPPVAFEARAMDLVLQLDFMDEFHIWTGRMLTPSDRSNFSGPWFIGAWDYPGVYSVPGQGFAYVGPRGTEEIGREVGIVTWGDIMKGKLKYYLGMMDIDDAPANTPLYTGRLGYAIIGSEPGFYGSSTYYGAQDIVAIGVASQYQKRFNLGPVSDDVFLFMADALAEFNVGTAGTIGLEGAFYLADSGDSAGVMPFDTAWFALASFTTPAVGPGKFQPLIRYQAANNDDGGPDMSIIEGTVSYLLKDYFAKLVLGFQHTDMDGGIEGNALQFGFQIQQ